MTATDMQSPGLSITQIGCILSDVTDSACAISSLANMKFEGNRDPRELMAVDRAITCLAERIGLLTDIALVGVNDMLSPLRGTDAVDWMMPAYFHEVESDGGGHD